MLPDKANVKECSASIGREVATYIDLLMISKVVQESTVWIRNWQRPLKKMKTNVLSRPKPPKHQMLMIMIARQWNNSLNK